LGRVSVRSRGHDIMTLAKKQCRLDTRKFSFLQRAINEWNRLSADCVGGSSVNILKNIMSTYLRRAGCTQIDGLDSRYAKGLPCSPVI